MQLGMLFHSLTRPRDGIDIEQIVVRSAHPLDPAELERSFIETARAHPVLTLYLDHHGGDDPQIACAPMAHLPVVVETCEPGAFEARIDAVLARERQRGFVLDHPPLMRLDLVTDGQRCALLWTFHHVLLDGRSFAPILEEVFLRYRGAAVRPSPRARFEDFAQWLDQQSFDLDFWRRTLAPVESGCLFPNLAQETEQSGFAALERPLDVTRTAQVAAAAERLGESMNAVLQAAWACLLHHYTDRREIVFGATYTTRYCGFEGALDMLGLMINTLPVVASVSADTTFAELVGALGRHNRAVREHVLTPLSQVQRLGAGGDTTLFDTAFIFDRTDLHQDMRARQAEWTDLAFKYIGQTNFPVAVIAYGGSELSLRLEYERSRIDDAHAAVLLATYETLLMHLCQAPGAPAASRALLGEEDRARYLTPRLAHCPPCGSLVDVFRAVCARHPGRVALRHEGETVSYAALDARSDAIAAALLDTGLRSGGMVGLCLAHSADLIAGMLGILKTGCAYVPINPNYPQTRIRFTLEDAGVGVLLSDAEHAGRLAGLGQVYIAHELAQRGLRLAPRPIAPESAAYVIYTSGSTGQPKGVVVTHRNVTRLFQSMQPRFAFDEHDVFTLFHSFAFDFSVFEVWGALTYGGEVVIVPHWQTRSALDFYRLVVTAGVTVLSQTPSAFVNFMEADQELRGELQQRLRYVVFGGEALDLATLQPWVAFHGDAQPRLINMYGITETTVHVTYRQIMARDIESGRGSLIGEPLADLDILLLNSANEPVPAGVMGEIYVAGDGVADGYLNRPELTAQRFTTQAVPGLRLYRSGDLARRLPDGDLVYCGRHDHQVKIRGFRIELGEIESAISSIPGVQQAVCFASTRTAGTTRLVAYFAAGAEVSAKAVGEHLARVLPAHMIPPDLIRVDAFPLNENGKVDRARLPEPQEQVTETAFRAPRTETEKQLASLWQRILGATGIGLDDNFFDRGGDSILSIKLVSAARKAGMLIGARDVFAHPTLAGLAGVAQGQQYARQAVLEMSEAPLAPVQQWYLEHIGARAHWNQSYCFRLSSRVSADDLVAAIHATVRRHPVLSMQLAQHGERWVQTVGHQGGAHVERINLDTVFDTASAARHACVLATNQAVRPEQGRNLCIGVMEYSDGVVEACFAAHHLVVDGLSWAVLIGEIGAYLKSPASLRQEVEKGFLHWCTLLDAVAFRNELAYWEASTRNHSEADGGYLPRARHRVTVALADLGWRAQGNVPKQDLMLAALLASIASQQGEAEVCIDLEHHGRAEYDTVVDFPDAIGWFTTIHPLTVRLEPAQLSQVLTAVHRELAAVPRHGIGYGILSAQGELRRRFADHLVDYLGNFGALFADDGDLTLLAPDYSTWRDPSAPHSHPVEWIIGHDDRSLSIDVFYDADRYPAATVERLATGCIANLGALCRLCLETSMTAERLTLGEVAWSQAQQHYPQMQGAVRPTPIQQLFLSAGRHGMEHGVERWWFGFAGRLDAAHLRTAWLATLANHTSLRSAFVPTDSGPVQVVLPAPQVVWRVADARDVSLSDALAEALDVQDGPLHRLTLLEVSPNRAVLVWIHHHLQIDGWSWPMVIEEVSGRYRALTGGTEVQVAPTDYRDYSAWIDSRRPKLDLAFWHRYLDNLGSSGRLPFAGGASRGEGRHRVTLPEAALAAARSCASSLGVTLSAVFHAAIGRALARLTARAEVCIGATFSGRPHDDGQLQSVIGPFVTNLPLRVSDAAPATVVTTVAARLLQLQDYQWFSPAEIHANSGLPWTAVMFETLVVYQNYEISPATFAFGDAVSLQDFDFPVHTAYPLSVVVIPGAEYEIDYVFDRARLDEAFIAALHEQVEDFFVAARSERSVAPRRTYTVEEPARPVCRGERPRSPVQAQLLAIWQGLFGYMEIGVTDNFFDLGGRSLMVPVLLDRIEQHTGHNVPLAVFFRDPTVAGIAAHLAGESAFEESLYRRAHERSDRSRRARDRAREHRHARRAGPTGDAQRDSAPTEPSTGENPLV